MQALLGVWVFHEAFTADRAIGFLIIWAALILYVAEGLWAANALNSGKMAGFIVSCRPSLHFYLH
jgi:hypothetical protein